MENKFFILYCFIFIHLLSLKLALKCQENEIENCIKCETGENSDKCALCEDKYFLALNGEVCIKCDDDNYGMVGCSGSCTFMKELSNVKCQEDSCKTGYYEIVPGYCSICSLIEENCLECDYLKTNSEFKCKKCKDHYFPNNDGLCELCKEEDCLKCTDQNFCIECIEGKTAYPDGKCYLNIENCKIGIYSTEKNSPICIECNINYYPDSNGICQKCESESFLTSCHKCHLDNGKLKCDEGSINTRCSYFSLSSCEMCSVKNDVYVCDECKEYSNSKLYITENGECRNCKSDSERGYCSVCSDDPKAPCDSCYKDSVLINDKCVRCDTLFDKCSMCSEKHCLKCYSGYGLLYEENCTSCIELFGEGCLSCGLNPYDGKPYCAECRYNYFYGVDGKCKNCKEDGNLANCKKCQELGKNGYICTQCENYYELLDGKCYKTCTIFEVRGIDGECRSCSSDEVGLSNCNQCQMMADGQYKCSDCYYGYKLINGKCVQIEEEEIKICDEIENISTEESPIYSCINCPSNEYVQIKKENGAKICLKNSEYQDMNACKFGSIISEEEKKYICNKCINNSELVYDEDLKKNKCICNDGYFFDTSKKECRKCDELDSGCLKCNASIIYNGYYNFNCFQCDKNYAKNDGHCFYCYGNCEECNINEDGSQECLKYKEPYFLSNTSEIKKCNDYLQNCVSCSYIDEEKTELDCKRCVDNYFKNKNGECVECKEINDGCLVCSDDEERFKNNKCDKCKNNYFMTKENTCEFCLSEKNGGNNCKECGYINTENEEEKIGCVKCIEPNYILLNGKCYSPIDNCKEYESYLNNNSEVKIRCKECNDKYELNKYYRCIKIKFYLQNCLKTNENVDNLECLECERGFDLIDKKCIDKTVSGDDEIKGCLNYETKYGYYYCVSCNNNYYLRNGNCVEKYKSNFLNDCKWSYFENGIFECNSCQGSSIKVSEHLLCNPQTVFNCDKLNNLGSELRPIYSCDNCKYYYNRIIMEDENGIKNCVYDIFDERCVEGKINTLYYNNTYTCTKCKKPYILSYSEFYERKICKDIYEEEKKSEFKIEDYESDQGIPIINGKCEDGYFTRNGKVCIKCNDVNIGMEGCGGKCDFKINREYQLKCEYNKCKEGYFEIIPGQCEKCENKLKGCNKCQYFENNENNYIILEPIRKRQLLCTDECQGKDIFKYDNKCLECKEIITNCEECIKVNDEIKCQKAKDGYFIDNNGIVIQCPSNCNKCTLVNENNKLNIKCLMTSDSKYFINQDGQVKTCDDYYEGIDYCSKCSYNNDKLVCNICQSGYIELDDKCYSCKEILDNQGCKYCSKNYSDNSYYCYSCEDNNILIKNIGKCIPKNDEIKNCSNVNKISINEEEYFYECNSCNYDYKLVKNLKNRTDCIYKNDIGEIGNYCYILNNLNTKLNPIYSCEKCNSGYTIIIAQNQIRSCKYSWGEGLHYCSEALKINIFDDENNEYKYIYNCTKCLDNYNLKYNNETNTTKCISNYCFVENCYECKENNEYSCKECKNGYVITKYDQCIIKPTITPNIYFKDIYRFSLNGNKKIDGEYLFGPIYTIRGLSKENVADMHTFIILSIFNLENGKRNLGETKQFKTYCKYKDKISSEETSLKLIDYDCIVDSEEEDLSNYKLSKVEESIYSDSSNLNAFDLENLVSKVEDLTKQNSIYTSNALDKYIYFIIDDNINKRFETNSTDVFSFSIKGKTDKVVYENIQGELQMNLNNDLKAKCDVDAKNKDDAALNCEINLENVDNTKSDIILTFGNDEILDEKYNVQFSGINNIEIFKFKVKIFEENYPIEEKDKENLGLSLGLSLGLGVPIIVVIVFFIIYCYKKKKGGIKIDNINTGVKIYKNEEAISQSERNRNLY